MNSTPPTLKNNGDKAMKNMLKKQAMSFFYALRGLGTILYTESHMRFHLVAAIYVIFFGAKFFYLSSAQWALLILTMSAVMVAEIINTALERACDAITTEYSKDIKFIKDTSAAAVLVTAIASVAVAFITLFKIDILRYIVHYYTSHIFSLVLLVLLTAVAVAFIAVKPQRYIDAFKKLTSNIRIEKQDKAEKPTDISKNNSDNTED